MAKQALAGEQGGPVLFDIDAGSNEEEAKKMRSMTLTDKAPPAGLKESTDAVRGAAAKKPQVKQTDDL